MYSKDVSSGPPGQGRHACNFFVEDGAAKVGIKNFLHGTASQIVVKLQEDGYEVTEVQAVNKAAGGKYLVVAGETAAELGQNPGSRIDIAGRREKVIYMGCEISHRGEHQRQCEPK